MPGRTYPGSTASNYRFGFNGKENDNEVKGPANQIDYGMRVYDPRAGRFLSVDPLTKQYPWYSPYQYAGNKPIFAVDVDGLEEASANKATWKQKLGFAFFGVTQIIMAGGNYLIKKENVSTTGGYKGPLADAGQKVITSVGSTLNGGLHAVTAGAWPLDPSATLGFNPSLNPGASNVGQAGGTVTSIGFGGTPGASLELAPTGNGSSFLQSLNQALHIPLTVYSNSSSTDDNSSNDQEDVNSPQARANGGRTTGDGVLVNARDLQLSHKESTITGSTDYQNIKKLSDNDLIQSVLNPKKYDPVTINTKTGKLVDGNTRIYEIQRRGLDVNVPVRKYTPDDSAFPDLQEPPKK